MVPRECTISPEIAHWYKISHGAEYKEKNHAETIKQLRACPQRFNKLIEQEDVRSAILSFSNGTAGGGSSILSHRKKLLMR